MRIGGAEAIRKPGMLTLTPCSGDSQQTRLRLRRTGVAVLLACMAVMACLPAARAEDGYDLWLRYPPIESARANEYRTQISQLVAADATPTQVASRAELLRGLHGMLGAMPALTSSVTRPGAR